MGLRVHFITEMVLRPIHILGKKVGGERGERERERVRKFGDMKRE